MAKFTLEEQEKLVKMLFYDKPKRSTQAEMDQMFGKDRIKKQNKKQVLANLIKNIDQTNKQYVEN